MFAEIIIFISIFFVYYILGNNINTGHDFFVPLADAFLKGRLYVDKMAYELHEMVSFEEVKTGIYNQVADGSKGIFYVIYPPMPAILLMPFVLIWGQDFNQSLFSMFICSLGSVFAFKLFKLFNLNKKKAVWLLLFLAFGSMQWYHGTIGSSWYLSLASAMLFLWIAISLTVKNKSLFLIGLFLGFAYLSRFSVILSVPFFLINTRNLWFKKKRLKIKPLLMFFLGIFLSLGISFLYNYLRYGTIWHIGYQLLEKRWYNIANEYAKGSYSLSYWPRHIKALFWSFPYKIKGFPFFEPNYHSMAIWIVMPAVILAFWAPLKKRIVWSSWLVIILIALSHFFHGGVGATQFGYRYAMDYLPFLFILFVQAIKKKFYWWQKALIILSIIINSWGLYFSFWR